MNVRNSLGPICERILNRTQDTLRLSVQKTRFCFITREQRKDCFYAHHEGKSYDRIGATVLFNCNLALRAVVSFTSQLRYRLNTKLGGHQSRCGRFGELLSLPGIERRFIGRPALIVVTIPNTLNQVQKLKGVLHMRCTCRVGRAERRKTVWPQKSRCFSCDKGALPLLS